MLLKHFNNTISCLGEIFISIYCFKKNLQQKSYSFSQKIAFFFAG